MSARLRMRLHAREAQPARGAPALNLPGERPLAAKLQAWNEPAPEVQERTAARGHEFAQLAVAVSDAPALPDEPEREAHLRAAIEQLIQQPGGTFPRRAEVEALLGQPLGAVQVYSGEAVRQLLRGLRARAAVYGDRLLLADPDPGLAVLLHEAAHLLQSRQAGQTGGAGGALEVIAADSPVEAEARAVGQRAVQGERAGEEGPQTDPPPLLHELAADALALQREEAGATPVETLERPRRPGMESWTVAPEAAPERRFEQALSARGEEGIEERPAPPEMEARTDTSPPAEAASAPTVAAGGEAAPEAGLAPADAPAPGAVDTAAQEQARAQAEAALQGAADVSGLVEAYAAAPPTVKARQASEMNQRAGALSQQEAQSLEGSMPEFHAVLNTQAESAPPLQVEAPTTREIALEQTPPAPVELPELPATPDAGHYAANDGVARGIEGWFGAENADPSAQIGESLGDVRTTDPDIPSTPGPPPAVPLEGETDPARLEAQSASSAEQGRQVRDEARQAVLDGPGPEQVQPLNMDEVVEVGALERPALDAPAAELPPRESPEAYLAMDLPAEVQAQFDQDQQGAMESSMGEAQAQVGQAAEERDRQREEQVNTAEAESRRLSQEADESQRQEVQSARQDIQDERQSTVDQQNEAVGNLERDAENRRSEEREEIEGRVQDDQGQIEGRYVQAETDANREIQAGEQRAEQRREQAEREASEQSWWERAVNFVRDAFNALVSAISAVFDAVRQAVNAVLDAAKAFAEGLIALAADFIKGAIAAFGEFLKGLVDALLGDIFPGLAAALNAFIDEAVSAAQTAVDAVASALRDAVNALIEGLRAGLNRIIDAFQAGIQIGLALLQAALTGDWSGLALKLLESVLRLIGVDPEAFYAFVGRAMETIQIIIDDPGGFVGNLVDAFLGGVRLFADNILTHLQASIIEWLTGALGGAGISLPERFDLMGVLSLVQQILGLTWERLRELAVRQIGERNVAILEHVFSYIETLVTGGWQALFDRIVQDLSGLVDMVLDGIRSFLVERIIMAAITRLATLFNPVGALVQLILAAWNVYTFLRDQLARIYQVVQTVVDAIGNIARGVLDPAMQAVETTLGRLLTLLIDFLARFLGLGGVAERVREIIETVRARVQQAITRLLERVAAAFRGGGERSAAGARPEESAEGEMRAASEGSARLVEPFSIAGEEHTITATVNAENATLSLSSRRQGLLYDILTEAIREVQERNDRDPRNADIHLVRSLRDARDEFRDRDMRQSWVADGGPGLFQEYVERRINLLITHLRAAFQNTHVRTLDQVFEDETLSGPRFLPVQCRGSRWIRPNLYERGRSWSNFRDGIVATERSVIVREVREAQANNDLNAWLEIRNRHRVPEDAQFSQFRPSDVATTAYDLDHVRPVFNHWNSSGHNHTDRARQDFYFDESNLRVVTEAWNRGRPSENYVNFVETNFTSALAEGENRNAREILDGTVARRFVDDQNRPI